MKQKHIPSNNQLYKIKNNNYGKHIAYTHHNQSLIWEKTKSYLNTHIESLEL